MNQTQTLKQVFSTVQQIKLRQLQLEVESLEKQVHKVLKIDEELSLEDHMRSPDSLIPAIGTIENAG